MGYERRDLESPISKPSEGDGDGDDSGRVAPLPGSPPKPAPSPSGGLCGKCGGEGFVMLPIASASGFPTERRERCATCNGVGAKRCNVEGRAGDLCKLAPGHEGEHKSERGVAWPEGVDLKPLGPWRVLQTDGSAWAMWGMAGEPVASDHFCAQGYPPPPDLESRYAIFCKRDRKWIDVTDVVVRGFVVPYEEHVVIPKAEESPAAPRPSSSDPEPLGDIVSRILKDLRALVRVASK